MKSIIQTVKYIWNKIRQVWTCTYLFPHKQNAQDINKYSAGCKNGKELSNDDALRKLNCESLD